MRLNEPPRLSECNLVRHQTHPSGTYLQREKEDQPLLQPQKHPHGLPPSDASHPSTTIPRVKTLGNDNSSVCRQSRSQTTKPDPIPGAPYAGASSQRMGSATLRRYQPNPTIMNNGALANKAAGMIRYGPPTPYLSPLQQEYARTHRNSALSQF